MKRTIGEIQSKIDSIKYWDSKILDLSINYFGDEVSIILYNDEESSWCLKFLSCHKLKYETDANWRSIPHVKTMKSPQLGYYGQEITVSESDDAEFFTVKMDLSIMVLEASFKEMTLDKVSNKELSFFWSD